MRTLLLLSGCLALLLASSSDADARKRRNANPLAPLAGLSKKITKAVNKAMRGTKSTAGGRIKTRITSRAKEKLTAAGVKSLQLAIFEFELTFQQGKTGLYYFRSMVHPGQRGPSFAALQGRIPSRGNAWSNNHPIASYRGVVAPLGKAAQNMLKQLKRKKRCLSWPITSLSAGTRLKIPGKLLKRFNRGIIRAKRVQPRICKFLRAMRNHTIGLRIDDAAFLARDAAGKVVGLASADMKVQGNKLLIVVKRFSPLSP